MSTTTASLFRRPKPLATILAGFNKAKTDLDDFIKAASEDVAGLDKQVERLTHHRNVAVGEIERAGRVKSKIADLVA